MSSSSNPLFPSYPHEDWRRHEPGLSEAIERVLASGSYILGGEVACFEAEFAAFLGVCQVVGLASGTDAIELMLRAFEIGPGAKVVVPSFAPSAVAAGVLHSGAGLVLADIEADTFTLSPGSLDAVLRSTAGQGVKAALAVHLFGHPVDWQGLQRVADEHGILLLEDCAQAHGTLWQGRMAGTLGRAAAFSFYPTKNLGALGDAGAVATNDDELAERLRWIRQYGWRSRHCSDVAGVNSRLDELQAAMLRVKLRTLAENVRKRRRLAASYDARLSQCGEVRRPAVRQGCDHAYHQYVLRCARRDELLNRLQQAGVPAVVHYAVPLHRQPALGVAVALPESDEAAGVVLSLPLHPYLPETALETVCQIICDDHAG
jgi:dTDP-3-amino-3,4,6-trideoxy-alpha-D-glucose transaminase